MANAIKCIWSSITDNLWLSILLLISIIVAIWVILAVQLCPNMRFFCGYDEMFCCNLNQVLLNLSYSYIAGYLFYLFTCWLPTLVRSIKMQPVLDAGFKDIKACIYNMYPLFHDIGEGNIDMNDIDKICEQMMTADWMEKQFAPLPNKNKVQHLSYFSKMLNDTIIIFIQLNKEVLSSYDLQKLNEIRNTNPLCTYETLQDMVIDNDNCSVLVDEYKKLLEVSKGYFGNLNA